MKRNLFQLLPLILTFLLFSCSKDDLMDEPTSAFESADLQVSIGRSTTPCAKSLSAMVGGSSLSIGCVSDLGGQTINIPKGAAIKFDGGTILNGTLHFDGGTIDGRLLNQNLKITGNVKLANSTYTFEPDQWGIAQGVVGNTKAFTNRENIENAIEEVKRLGGNTFKIGKLDAYFDVVKVRNTYKGYFIPWVEAINIPSNFHVQLSDNTVMRVQPNNSYEYALFCMNQVTNAKLSGGKLYGDREKHSFNGDSRFPTHEWGVLVSIHGAENSTVENVKMYKANGDNMKIESEDYLFNPGYTPSKHITVRGCTFDSARRNGLSVVGAEDVLIENNDFLRSGTDIGNSKGTNPRFALDIEAFTKIQNGKEVLHEKVDGVVVRNNTQKLAARGGFLNSRGSNVIFELNRVQNGIGYTNAINTIIRYNTITAKTPGHGTGITAGRYNDDTKQKNNKVYGNTVRGCEIGIQIRRQDNRIFNNKFKECTIAMQAQFLKDNKIYDNVITSSVPASKGINFYYTSLDNVEISHNSITTKGNALNFVFINSNKEDKNKKAYITNNTIHTDYVSAIRNSKNLKFDGNKMYSAFEVYDVEKITFNNNLINANKARRHTIKFRGNITDITISNNDLTAHKGLDNTYIDNRVKKKNYREWGNKWHYQK